VGTYDGTLYTLAYREREWVEVPTSPEASGPINSIAFERDTAVIWYGTAGGGFARSVDRGASWRRWPQAADAGWTYVVPRGIVVRRDSVWVATTDGLRVTADGGQTWRCIQGTETAAGAAAAQAQDGCTERFRTLATSHLLSLEVSANGAVVTVGHLRGMSRSGDGGRTWTDVTTPGLAGQRVRSVRLGPDSLVWALTERALFADSPRAERFREISLRVPGFDGLPGAPRAIIAQPGQLPVLVATSYGMLAETAGGDYRLHFLSAADRFRPAGDIWSGGWWGPPMIPIGGSSAGLNRILAGESPLPAFIDAPPRAPAEAGRHLRLARPVTGDDVNPYADGTTLFGAPPAAMSGPGGAGAASQRLRFMNPAGTPVQVAAAGTVVRAAQGTVVIRHGQPVEGRVVHTAYSGLGAPEVQPGQQVQAGATLGRVGSDVRPAGVRFSVHALAAADTAGLAAGATQLPRAVNPHLWLEPLPGTGVVAGRVVDAAGAPVHGTVIHGLVLPYPTEAPFSRVRSYPAGVEASPVYGEHFALGDVPAGDYMLGVTLDGTRVWRRVRVEPGRVSWVEFRP
jgi:hypothetical protein